MFGEVFTLATIKVLFDKLGRIRGKRKVELEVIESVFGSIKELGKFYIEPDCQLLNPADDADISSPARNFRLPVFRAIEDFLGSGSTKSDGRNQLMILGDAGMGKTSLLVILKLQHLLSFLPNKYSCTLIKISKETIREISEILSPSSTILLLDALDEDSTGYGRVQNRILELLAASKNFYKVIITCRTQFFPKGGGNPFSSIGEIRLGGYICPAIFLSYFTPNQVDLYLHLRFDYNDAKIKKAREIFNNVETLCFRPLLLSYVDDLIESSTPLTTRSAIYHTLVHKWLLREQVKLMEQGRTVTAEELFQACGEIAVFLTEMQMREVAESQLSMILHNTNSIQGITNVDVGGRSLLNRDSQGNFRFSHNSIKEFLFAESVAKGMTDLSFGSVYMTDLELEFLFSNSLQGLDLRFIRFANNEIRDAYFHQSTFTKMVFKECPINGAQFVDCNMDKVTFNGCKFYHSTFLECGVSEMAFIGCSGEVLLHDCVGSESVKVKNNSNFKVVTSSAKYD